MQQDKIEKIIELFKKGCGTKVVSDQVGMAAGAAYFSLEFLRIHGEAAYREYIANKNRPTYTTEDYYRIFASMAKYDLSLTQAEVIFKTKRNRLSEFKQRFPRGIVPLQDVEPFEIPNFKEMMAKKQKDLQKLGRKMPALTRTKRVLAVEENPFNQSLSEKKIDHLKTLFNMQDALRSPFATPEQKQDYELLKKLLHAQGLYTDEELEHYFIGEGTFTLNAKDVKPHRGTPPRVNPYSEGFENFSELFKNSVIERYEMEQKIRKEGIRYANIRLLQGVKPKIKDIEEWRYHVCARVHQKFPDWDLTEITRSLGIDKVRYFQIERGLAKAKKKQEEEKIQERIRKREERKRLKALAVAHLERERAIRRKAKEASSASFSIAKSIKRRRKPLWPVLAVYPFSNVKFEYNPLLKEQPPIVKGRYRGLVVNPDGSEVPKSLQNAYLPEIVEVTPVKRRFRRRRKVIKYPHQATKMEAESIALSIAIRAEAVRAAEERVSQALHNSDLKAKRSGKVSLSDLSKDRSAFYTLSEAVEKTAKYDAILRARNKEKEEKEAAYQAYLKEEEKRQAEQEAKRKAELEAKQKAQAEAEAKRRAQLEEEANKRAQAEQYARRKAQSLAQEGGYQLPNQKLPQSFAQASPQASGVNPMPKSGGLPPMYTTPMAQAPMRPPVLPQAGAPMPQAAMPQQAMPNGGKSMPPMLPTPPQSMAPQGMAVPMVNNNVPVMPQGVPQGMPPQGMPQGMVPNGQLPPQTMVSGMLPQGMPQTITAQAMAPSMPPQGMPQAPMAPQGMAQAMPPQGMAPGMPPQGMPQAMPPQNMAPGMPPQGMPQAPMPPVMAPQPYGGMVPPMYPGAMAAPVGMMPPGMPMPAQSRPMMPNQPLNHGFPMSNLGANGRGRMGILNKEEEELFKASIKEQQRRVKEQERLRKSKPE